MIKDKDDEIVFLRQLVCSQKDNGQNNSTDEKIEDAIQKVGYFLISLSIKSMSQFF